MRDTEALKKEYIKKLIGLTPGEHHVYYTNQPRPPIIREHIYRRDQWRFDAARYASEHGYGALVQDKVGHYDARGYPHGQYNYLFIRNRKK